MYGFIKLFHYIQKVAYYKHPTLYPHSQKNQHMGSLYVQIGQCGCQIGKKLNEKLADSYYSTRLHGIHGKNKVHAIMMDTQPKVLKPLLDNPPVWIDSNNIKYFQYGRGNNWSYGYMHELSQKNRKHHDSRQLKDFKLIQNTNQQNLKQYKQQQLKKQNEFISGHRQFSHLPTYYEDASYNDPNSETNKNGDMKHQYNINQHEKIKQPTKFEQQVLLNKYLKQNKQISEYSLNTVRKQLEHTDCPLCINVICSLGGGTGSGLGTKLIQKLSEQFAIDTYAHVILPNKSGQTPLQIYNCALSLASIQQYSTAIFPYQNDNMINMFLQQATNKQQNKGNNDLQFINNQIANLQARLFKINQIDGYERFYTDIVSECIVSNQLKYISLFGASSSKNNNMQFDQSIEKLYQQLRVYNEQIYQIEGIDTRRQKCIVSSMLVTSPSPASTTSTTDSMLQQNNLKKLKSLINPMHPFPTTAKNYSNNNFYKFQEYRYPQKNKNKNIKNNDKSDIVFLMNHSNISRYLEYLLLSGRKKMEAKAYLWHYEYADLQGGFNKIETVIDQYRYYTV